MGLKKEIMVDFNKLNKIRESRSHALIVSKQRDGRILIRYLDEDTINDCGGPFFKEFILDKTVTLKHILNILKALE